MQEASEQGVFREDNRSAIDGLNLAEFPMALLTAQQPADGRKTLRFEETIKRGGELIAQKVTITGSDEFGLPTCKHHDLMFAAMQLHWEQNRWATPRFDFSAYELLKKVRWARNGYHYALADKALKVYKGTNYFFENAWYSSGKFRTRGFGIIDHFDLYRSGKHGKGRRTKAAMSEEPSYIHWGNVIFEDIHARVTKGFDFDLYISLKSEISKQLYRHLDKWFYYDSAFKHPDVVTFAREKIGLSRNYKKPSKYIELLEVGARELEERSYLKPLNRAKRFPPRGDGVYEVYFARASSGRRRKQRGEVISLDSGNNRERKSTAKNETGSGTREGMGEGSILERLIACGVKAGPRKKQANWLVANHDTEKITRCIEHWKRLNEKLPANEQKGVGYLIASITSDDERGFVPKEFKTKEDRKRELDAKKEQKEKQRRTELQSRAKEQWINKDSFEAFTRARELFPPEKREQLEADALSRANPIVRDGVLREREEGTIGLFHRMLWEGQILPEYADEVESVWNPEDEERRAEQEARFEETDRRVRRYLSGLSVSEYAELEEAAAQNVSGELAGRIKSVEDIRRSPFGWAAVMSYVEQRLDAIEDERGRLPGQQSQKNQR